MRSVSGKRIPCNGCIIQSDSTRKVHGNGDEVKWKRLKRNSERIFKARRVVTVTVDTTLKSTSFPCISRNVSGDILFANRYRSR